ncbi:MAG TPA: Fe-S protein assembly co-chaperone HscB [Polyangiaceae bacterium]|nr:Fe-S protein assembly co-chaperone HscB [Polyangiaceae bacterium]
MTSPFELLGVPLLFALDEQELEKRHRDLSRALHPDRYAGRPSSERREALSRAISVNEAFRQLRDPLSRAEALLSQLGRDVTETNLPRPEPSLLMRVMEQREALSAARRAGDRSRVEAIAAQAGSAAEDVTERMSDAFSEDPIPVEQVLQLLGELRYLKRLKDEAGSALDEL